MEWVIIDWVIVGIFAVVFVAIFLWLAKHRRREREADALRMQRAAYDSARPHYLVGYSAPERRQQPRRRTSDITRREDDDTLPLATVAALFAADAPSPALPEVAPVPHDTTSYFDGGHSGGAGASADFSSSSDSHSSDYSSSSSDSSSYSDSGSSGGDSSGGSSGGD